MIPTRNFSAAAVFLAAVVEGDSLGVQVTSLIGSLGAAGAAVCVTYYFLGFLREASTVFQKVVDDLKIQLDILATRQEKSQQAFQDQLNLMARDQNIILHEVVAVMRSIDNRPRRSRADAKIKDGSG